MPIRTPQSIKLGHLSHLVILTEIEIDKHTIKPAYRLSTHYYVIRDCVINMFILTWLPIQSDKPETLHPSAKANPPPNIKITPHGSFFSTSFQLRIDGDEIRDPVLAPPLNDLMKDG